MNRVLVDRPRYSSEGERVRVSATLQMPDQELEIYYSASRGPLSTSLDPFLAAALLPAMKVHAPLHVAGPVSRKLLRATRRIQEIIHTWDKEMQPVSVSSDSEVGADTEPNPAAACFFSGGLDSFYTVLKHRHEIESLIIVEGYSIHLADRDAQADVSSHLRAAASELGLRPLEVETNVAEATLGYFPLNIEFGPPIQWAAALTSVGMLLAPLFGRVFMAAAHSYGHFIPSPFHPLLDSLWSTDSVEIIDDGHDATRVDKAALVGSSQAALRHLRVCWKSREPYDNGLYNCGRCEKCIRTQINLYLVGALERCETLPRTLDLEAISRLYLHDEKGRIFTEENLEAAERLRADPRLIEALRTALDRSGSNAATREISSALSSELQHLEEDNDRLRTTIEALYRSRSWRLTGPLRAFSERLRRSSLKNR